ncbi:hypothetical protein ARMGADRAFT_1082137 [Armillaria gallica]|uniref:Uncharacterized protein n=1 Tax=Armillaria gallica TaxID=47427 RepID=A0A2H3DRI9_ARMGA|nr:hypothetical protein ARMGADRAFT_1082137 [Armillaria gallica]
MAAFYSELYDRPPRRPHPSAHSLLSSRRRTSFDASDISSGTLCCTPVIRDAHDSLRRRLCSSRRLPGDRGMHMDAWIEALTMVLLLMVSLRTIRLCGQIYLDARHRVRSGVQELLMQLTTLTLDGVFSSSLAGLAAFFGYLLHSKRLVMNFVIVGRGDDEDKHEGRLCKELQTLKVGNGYLRVGWMRFLFGDGVISFSLVSPPSMPASSLPTHHLLPWE